MYMSILYECEQQAEAADDLFRRAVKCGGHNRHYVKGVVERIDDIVVGLQATRGHAHGFLADMDLWTKDEAEALLILGNSHRERAATIRDKAVAFRDALEVSATPWTRSYAMVSDLMDCVVLVAGFVTIPQVLFEQI